jgi:hypothetical protein
MRALLLVLVLASACHKADVQKCDLGCRNYFKLHYWKEADQEINDAPAEQRDQLRTEKEADFDKRLNENLELCVNKCESGADKHRVQCWIDATTAEDAEKCQNDD